MLGVQTDPTDKLTEALLQKVIIAWQLIGFHLFNRVRIPQSEVKLLSVPGFKIAVDLCVKGNAFSNFVLFKTLPAYPYTVFLAVKKGTVSVHTTDVYPVEYNKTFEFVDNLNSSFAVGIAATIVKAHGKVFSVRVACGSLDVHILVIGNGCAVKIRLPIVLRDEIYRPLVSYYYRIWALIILLEPVPFFVCHFSFFFTCVNKCRICTLIC